MHLMDFCVQQLIFGKRLYLHFHRLNEGEGADVVLRFLWKKTYQTEYYLIYIIIPSSVFGYALKHVKRRSL